MSSTVPSTVLDGGERVRRVSTSPRRQAEAYAAGWVWFELTGQTQLVLTGPDRQKFLHNFCTNDIKGLSPNVGCEAFITTLQGKLLGQVTVWNGATELTLLGPPGQSARILKHLSKYHINEDLEIADVSLRRSTLLLAGTEVEQGLQAVLGEERPWEAGTTGSLSQQQVNLGTHPIWIRREEWLGRPSYGLTIGVEGVGLLRERVVAAGRGLWGVEAGPELFDWLRIGAGYAWHGVDLDESNLAQEASRTTQAIHFRKGCYLGQEPIARIDALGHVNQQIRRVVLAGEEVPETGSELLTMDEPPRPAGKLTGAVRNPAGEGVKGLAMIRRGHERPGTKLRVACGGGWREAVVEWTDGAS